MVRLLSVLPEDSRFVACLRAEPTPRREPGEPIARPEPWREWWGWTRTHSMLADLFEATLAPHAGKGRQRIKYPRPGEKASGQTSFAALIPKAAKAKK